MSNRRMLLNAVSIFSLLTFAYGGDIAPAAAREASTSPMAGVSSEEYNYPSGGHLVAQYQTVNQPIALPAGTGTAKSKAVGFAAAAQIQTGLPEGFTLQPGFTARISATEERAPDSSSREATAAGFTEKYIAFYPIAYQGIPLSKGSDYVSVIAGDGRVLVTRKRALPELVDATQATVVAEAALDAGRQQAAEALAGVEAVVSQPTLEILVDENRQGRLAWTFTVASPSVAEPKARRYWVAATGEPAVLKWESLVYHTHQGEVTGTVWSKSPFDADTSSQALRNLQVNRSDAATASTNGFGRYAFDSGTGSMDLDVELSGENVVVENQSGAGMTVAKTGTPEDPIDFNFGASTDDERAQTTAFFFTTDAYHMAQQILSLTDLAALPARTNIAASCNAYWDGASINFYQAGGGCPNTAYSDVIYHEYGHGIDDRKGGILDSGYSEGFGDAVALLGTRQSCTGRDFFGAGTCLRRATDVYLWPPAVGEDVHDIGRRYAGFTWQLIQELTKTSGEDAAYDIATRLAMAAALSNPADIPDAVYLNFVADDNDGDLTNGSPHFAELAAAADSRAIPRPADPVPLSAVNVAASAAFPWTSAQQVSVNSNILEATIHLNQPAVVHISTNSSANSVAAASFRTGLYNDSATNVMWTDSYREVSLPDINQWENFGSKMAVSLPAGDHTIYWKVWISGATITLSSGTLLVEAFSEFGRSAGDRLGRRRDSHWA